MLLFEYDLRHTGKHTNETSAMLFHIGIINLLTMENIFTDVLNVTENESCKIITFTNIYCAIKCYLSKNLS